MGIGFSDIVTSLLQYILKSEVQVHKHILSIKSDEYYNSKNDQIIKDENIPLYLPQSNCLSHCRRYIS